MMETDEYKEFSRFVRENNVGHSPRPVPFDLPDRIYVAHESHLPDQHFEPLFSVIKVDGEKYWLVKKIGGFNPKLVDGSK